jgi:hypothetical protein
MRGQPVLADVDALDQAALHHVPAEHALQAAQHEDPAQLPRERTPHLTP